MNLKEAVFLGRTKSHFDDKKDEEKCFLVAMDEKRKNFTVYFTDFEENKLDNCYGGRNMTFGTNCWDKEICTTKQLIDAINDTRYGTSCSYKGIDAVYYGENQYLFNLK